VDRDPDKQKIKVDKVINQESVPVQVRGENKSNKETDDKNDANNQKKDGDNRAFNQGTMSVQEKESKESKKEAMDENDASKPDLTNERLPPSSKPKHNTIVYTGDSKSFLGVLGSIQSILKFNSTPIDFYFVGDEPLAPPLTFVNFINVSSLDLSGYTPNPIKTSHLSDSKTVFARYELPNLFEDKHHLMYLDTDTIVKCDVQELFDVVEKTPHPVAAARHPRLSCIEDWVLANETIPFMPEIKKRSFNNGMFMMNIPNWKSDKITEKVKHYLDLNAKKPFFRCQDQPAMAFAVGSNFKAVSKYWNVAGLGHVKDMPQETLDRACLVHWTGWRKPWVDEYGLYQDLWRDLGGVDPDTLALHRITRPE